MRNGTTFLGILLGAAGVVVGMRGAFDSGSVPMAALGVLIFAAGIALVFRGHDRGR